MPNLAELSANQRRMLIDTRQIWDAWEAAYRRRLGYAGSLSWKGQHGGEYLVRIFDDPQTTVRKMRSLGRRSPETEKVFSEFRLGREEAKQRLESLTARLQEQARLNRAVDLGRVPVLAARVLRRLHREGLLGQNVHVAGTNAIYAYEAAAGVFVERDLLATGDLDILLDAKAKLRLTVEGDEPKRLVDVLKSVDRSFEPLADRRHCAVNKDGYFVDLIKAEPNPPWRNEREGFGDGDLRASMIQNMRWISNAPRFSTVAVGEDGQPVPMSCPDPRAFALYKLWMGTNDPTRDPVKKLRDVMQAHAVAEIVHNYIPQLPFEAEQMKFFPRKVVDLGSEIEDPFFGPR